MQRAAVICAIAACATPPARAPASPALADAFAELVAAIRASDAHRIAALYTDDAEASNAGDPPILGAAAIERMLHGFDGAITVRAYDATIATTDPGDPGAPGAPVTQRGSYRQVAHLVADDRDVTVCGDFAVTWRHADRWRIARMHTEPHPCAAR